MSTFSSPSDAVAGSLARSGQLNTLDAAVAAAFALLPTNAQIDAGTVNFAVDTGTANAYIVALPQTATSYVDGLLVIMRPKFTNTTVSTINVDSLGVKDIKTTDGSNLVATSIIVGTITVLIYSSLTGDFHLINDVGAQRAAAASATAAAASETAAAASAVLVAIDEVVAASTGSLSVANCQGNFITNQGQSTDNTQTLPTVAAGLNGMVSIATAASGAFHLKAGPLDKIFLDGVALDDGDKVSLASPAVGDHFTFFAVKTGATSYDWAVRSGVGALTDGGA